MFQIVIDGITVDKTRKPIHNWREAYYELIFLACVRGFKHASVYYDGWERKYIIKNNGKVALER